MPKPPVPGIRELRQLFGQLCDHATEVAASFQACRCNEDARSTGTDGRGAASAGDDLSDEVLKRTLARLSRRYLRRTNATQHRAMSLPRTPGMSGNRRDRPPPSRRNLHSMGPLHNQLMGALRVPRRLEPRRLRATNVPRVP